MPLSIAGVRPHWPISSHLRPFGCLAQWSSSAAAAALELNKRSGPFKTLSRSLPTPQASTLAPVSLPPRKLPQAVVSAPGQSAIHSQHRALCKPAADLYHLAPPAEASSKNHFCSFTNNTHHFRDAAEDLSSFLKVL